MRPAAALSILCRLAVLSSVLWACADRSTPRNLPAGLGGGSEIPRRASASAAEGDALAAALLAASGFGPVHAASPAVPTPLDATFVVELQVRALDHLRIAAVGAGDGPSTAGSARVRRLAGAVDAPRDRNGDGTNLDDTLAAETAALAALAGAAPPAVSAPTLVARDGATALLANPSGPRDRDDFAAQRTVEHAGRTVSLERLGHAWFARIRAGSGLAEPRRGALIGADAPSGSLGLVLLQQALAIEETLLTDLAFDGSTLGALPTPAEYDPAITPRWWPAAFEYIERSDLPRAPAEWVVVDRASDLRGLAALLRAATELAWLTDPENPSAPLRALFVDTPLAPPIAGGPPPESVTWSEDVRPILHGEAGCLGCHAPPTTNSNFSVATYESVLAGGRWANPAVIPGDAAASPLWLVLNGPWLPPGRPFPLPRMPNLRPQLPPENLETIRAWIDGGALRDPPPPPPRPRAGIDLARALVRNVVAQHEVADGALAGLLDRRVGSARSGLADAAATGALLEAAAALLAIEPTEPDLRPALERWAIAARDLLTDPDGTVHVEIDLRTGARATRGATLGVRSALASGLLATGRVLGRDDIVERGSAVANALLLDSWHPESGWFDVVSGAAAQRLTSGDLATTLGMLHELQLAGDPTAREVVQRVLGANLDTFVFSEFEGRGEVIGDGIADTDGNGVDEPGALGFAPLFADAVVRGGDGTTLDVPITWSRDVLPVFRARCTGCHLAGADRGAYRIDTPELAATAGESGRATIVPGEPDASLLFRKLADRPPPVGAQMPLDAPPLGARDLALVRRWILEGARDR